MIGWNVLREIPPYSLLPTALGGRIESEVRTFESRRDWLAPAITCFLCLLPPILFWKHFRLLYWFHDDWELISQMESTGILRWMVQPFAENFNPLFKALWAAAVIMLHGSYAGMIRLLWGTHVSILLLLAALLRQTGFSWMSQSLAILTLGISWSNIETLGWATQWSSLLATLFFLLAWVILLSSSSGSGPKRLAVTAAMALASALSFSRGVLSGAVLTFFTLRWPHDNGDANRWHRWAAACLASVTISSFVPYRWVLREYPSFQGLSGEKLAAMASYSAHYMLLSPLFHLLPIPHKTPDGLAELSIAGSSKAVIIATGLLLAKDRQRTLLWTLLLLDLGTSGLLGFGRYNLGIDTAVSYRYQYNSLLCFAPFLGIVAEACLHFLRRSFVREAGFAVIFVGWALLLGYPWARHSGRWAQWRGIDVRNALAATPADQRFGLPSITDGRARELVALYNLH